MAGKKNTAVLRGLRRLRCRDRGAARYFRGVQASGKTQSSRGNGDGIAAVQDTGASRVPSDKSGGLDADCPSGRVGQAGDDGLCRYSSGAVRSQLSVRYDLLPVEGLRAAAEAMCVGAARYGAGNWERGIPSGELLNHALNHIYLWLAGDRSEDHLSHATCNLLMASHQERKVGGSD